MLGKAIALAAKIHEDQTDKAGKPYILHPIRMMMRLRTEDEELMAIAILHDVVEDSNITLEELSKMGFSTRIVLGVDGLTRRTGEEYEAFIHRCALNPDSKIIKREDLRDNSDITRLKGLRKKDFDRMEKYHHAYVYLSDQIMENYSGVPQLAEDPADNRAVVGSIPTATTKYMKLQAQKISWVNTEEIIESQPYLS